MSHRNQRKLFGQQRIFSCDNSNENSSGNNIFETHVMYICTGHYEHCANTKSMRICTVVAHFTSL